MHFASSKVIETPVDQPSPESCTMTYVLDGLGAVSNVGSGNGK
jgi:hypothetical protein